MKFIYRSRTTLHSVFLSVFLSVSSLLSIDSSPKIFPETSRTNRRRCRQELVVTPMEDGFGMRLIHSTLTPRIAPRLILDSGASKMAGMMTVTGSGSGGRTAAISRGMSMAINFSVLNSFRILFNSSESMNFQFAIVYVRKYCKCY